LRKILRILPILGFVIFGVSLLSQTKQVMNDPIFGLTYDPGKVVFDKTPERVRTACPELREKTTWVYAHLRTTDTEYFILSGRTKPCANNANKCTTFPDTSGTAVALRGKHCQISASDGFYWAQNFPASQMPESTLDEFASDALNRYSRAFGGKQAFLGRLTAKHEESVAPALRRKLQNFKK
jgi:hypothetical protein